MLVKTTERIQMNKYKIITVWMLASAVITSARGADNDEIVVSATRVASSSKDVASSVTVITADDIARKKPQTVVDLLRDVPGVYLVQNGGVGTTANMFIRGAQTEQTLVLIDGVEINDPMSPGRAPFYSNLDVENIARIEILRGAQSCLYGSDALAGVVSIETVKGEGPASAYVILEGGSFNTFRESAGLSGGSDTMNYSVSLFRYDTDGISAAREEDGNTEKDGHEQSSVATRLGFTPNDVFEIDMTARYIDSESEFDASGGPGGDAEENISKRESLLASLQANVDLFDSVLRQGYRVTMADHERFSKSAWSDSRFDSRLYKGEWQNDIYISDASILTIGAEVETEEGETQTIPEVSSDTTSLFAQQMIGMGCLNVAAGLRWDDRENFGDETTYRIAPVCNLNDAGTRIKGTYGTGFKAPSLYQLYAPASTYGPIGNPDLKPEESEGWDAGVEQELCEGRVKAGVTYFRTDYKDMIEFESGYVNKTKVRTSGVEVFADLQAAEDIAVGVSYTYTDAEDRISGHTLTRRPRNMAVLDMSYDWSDKGNVTVGVLYADDRSDRYYDSSMVTYVDTTLDEYILVNLAASYELNNHLELFARVDNVFDEDYEEVKGYGTPGVSGYGGVRATL